MPAPDLVPFDFPELEIGIAVDEDGPTGVTAVLFTAGAMGAVDLRGGAVASREDHALSALNTWGEVDGLVFAGGSSFGLAAVDGVMHGLLEDRDGSVAPLDIPSVPAAVVHDFAGRDNAVYPDAELGFAAYEAAKTGLCPTGAVGAGRNVRVGSYLGDEYAQRSGQGAAFAKHGETRVLALVVLNALGNLYDAEGRFVAGARDPKTGLPLSPLAEIERALAASEAVATGPRPGPGQNTTLSCLVTNVALDRPTLRRVAVQGHAALAQRISPFHTAEDGDACYALSTQSAKLPAGVSPSDFGVFAGRVLQQALDSIGFGRAG